MKTFQITTEVKHTVTYVYEVKAESQEEAEEIVVMGEMRGMGNISHEEEDWGTEILTSTNEL
jgi:hypothetical protein